MKSFMSYVTAYHYRVDFITVHWYSGADSAVFINYLKKIHDMYKRPLWITEFAVADWSAKTMEENPYSPAEVLSFMKKILPELDKLDFIQRYSWRSPPYNKPQNWSSSLFNPDCSLTALGKYYSQYQYPTKTGVRQISYSIPSKLELFQNYPNPFNPVTLIKYSIPERQFVNLTVYNVLGQKIAVLVNAHQNPGNYEVTFNAHKLPSEVYIYSLKTNKAVISYKMLLLK